MVSAIERKTEMLLCAYKPTDFAAVAAVAGSFTAWAAPFLQLGHLQD